MGVLKVDTITREILDYYKSMTEASRENYLHREEIKLAVIGKLKTAGGFMWKLDNEELDNF